MCFLGTDVDTDGGKIDPDLGGAGQHRQRRGAHAAHAPADRRCRPAAAPRHRREPRRRVRRRHRPVVPADVHGDGGRGEPGRPAHGPGRRERDLRHGRGAGALGHAVRGDRTRAIRGEGQEQARPCVVAGRGDGIAIARSPARTVLARGAGRRDGGARRRSRADQRRGGAPRAGRRGARDRQDALARRGPWPLRRVDPAAGHLRGLYRVHAVRRVARAAAGAARPGVRRSRRRRARPAVPHRRERRSRAAPMVAAHRTTVRYRDPRDPGGRDAGRGVPARPVARIGRRRSSI